MKQDIKVFEHAAKILQSLQQGVLLTTKANDKVNSMTISWGTLGIEWGKPIFTAFVRESRFTRYQLDQNPEFTINLPAKGYDKNILAVCGTKSGKEHDKMKELALTLEDPLVISVPGIRQLPLTLECKVVYVQKQDETKISAGNLASFYPQEVESSFHGSNKDFHIAYYGEIVAAYLIE